MNCMVFDRFGRMGVWLSLGVSSIHNMLGLSQPMNVHVLERHVHVISLSEIMMFSGQLCWLLAFTRI